MEDSTTSHATDRNEAVMTWIAFTFLTVSGRAPTQLRVFVHSCLAFVHSCLADKKSGRNHKISGSPVAGPVFRYSTGKTGRVGKYEFDGKLPQVAEDGRSVVLIDMVMVEDTCLDHMTDGQLTRVLPCWFSVRVFRPELEMHPWTTRHRRTRWQKSLYLVNEVSGGHRSRHVAHLAMASRIHSLHCPWLNVSFRCIPERIKLWSPSGIVVTQIVNNVRVLRVKRQLKASLDNLLNCWRCSWRISSEFLIDLPDDNRWCAADVLEAVCKIPSHRSRVVHLQVLRHLVDELHAFILASVCGIFGCSRDPPQRAQVPSPVKVIQFNGERQLHLMDIAIALLSVSRVSKYLPYLSRQVASAAADTLPHDALCRVGSPRTRSNVSTIRDRSARISCGRRPCRCFERSL